MARPRRSREDAADALAAVAPLAALWIERLLAAHEPQLSVQQFLALRAAAAERPAAAELARRAGVSGAAVSQLVAALERAGLVRREPEAGDRRRLRLEPTPAGERALASASALLRARLAELLAPLPPPELDALSCALPAVEAALSGSPPPRRPPPPPPPKRRP